VAKVVGILVAKVVGILVAKVVRIMEKNRPNII
jgi:hypothetical protein